VVESRDGLARKQLPGAARDGEKGRGRAPTHAGLILLPSTRTRTRHAIAAVAGAIENVLRGHLDGLSKSERWIGPLPNL
jgi:hypothetical protein